MSRSRTQTVTLPRVTDRPPATTATPGTPLFEDHSPDDDTDDDVPLGYDPNYEPGDEAETDYPVRDKSFDNPFAANPAPSMESIHVLTEGGEYSNCDAVYVTKLNPMAIIPSRATTGAVGYDLCSTQQMLVQPQGRSLIST